MPARCPCKTDCGKIKYVNLTGSVIRIFDPSLMTTTDDKYGYLNIGYDEKLFDALATMIIHPDDPEYTTLVDSNVKLIEEKDDCVTNFMYVYESEGSGDALPEPEPDTVFIVTEQVYKVFSHRTDLAVPYKPVKCYNAKKGSTEDTPFGYCGLKRSFTGSSSDVSQDSYFIEYDDIHGAENNTIRLNKYIKFTKNENVEAEDSLTVEYAPINCTITDETIHDSPIVTNSGEKRTISGTLEEITAIIERLWITISDKNGELHITYNGRTVTLDVISISIEYDDIKDVPENIVTYVEMPNDEDATALKLTKDGEDAFIPVF